MTTINLQLLLWNNSTSQDKPLKNLFVMQKSGVSDLMSGFGFCLGTPLKISFQEFEAPLGSKNCAEENWEAVSYLALTDGPAPANSA